MKKQPPRGYIYPLTVPQFRRLCQRVCKNIGASQPVSPTRNRGSGAAIKAKLGSKILHLFMTPWLMPVNQLVDIAYFCVIVDEPSKRDENRHYYISLCKPSTIALSLKGGLAVDQDAVESKLIEFIQDSKKPLAEAKYKIGEKQDIGNYGAWSGNVEPLPSSFFGLEDPFLKAAE